MKNQLTLLTISILLCSAPLISDGQTVQEIDRQLDSIKRSNFNDAAKTKQRLDVIADFASKMGWTKQVGYAKIILGYIEQIEGKQRNAIKIFNQTATIAKKIKDDELLARCIGNIGNSFFYLSVYDTAAHYAFDAIRLGEKLNNNLLISYKYGDLGNIMIRTKNYAKATEYLQKAFEYARKAGNEQATINFYNSLGAAYRWLGKPSEMLQSYQNGLAMAKKHNNPRAQQAFHINIAAYYSDNKQIQESLEYLKAAEDIALKIREKINLPTIYGNLSEHYLEQKKFDSAFLYNKKAEILAKENDDKFLLSEIYHTLSLIEEKRENLESALNYRKLNNTLKDELFSEKSQKEIENLKIKYETEKKENAIKLLNSENALQKQTIEGNRLQLLAGQLELDKKNLLLGNQNLLISNQQLELKNNQTVLTKNTLELKNKEQKISILNLSDKNKSLEIQKKNRMMQMGVLAFLLSALACLLFYNRYRLRQKNKLQKAIIKEQDESAKAVIKAEENERSRMSQTLHDGLGQLLSAAKMNLQAFNENLQLNPQMTAIYNNTLMLVDDSIKEMRSVSHQMVTNNVVRTGLANALKELIEKLDSNQLRINLTVNGLLHNIDPDIQVVVYRIIQECINNVIRHAEADNVDIDLNMTNRMLTGSITDNGKGFDVSSIKRSGIGLDNIETRIKFLKGTYKISSTKNSGTSVSFEIPL